MPPQPITSTQANQEASCMPPNTHSSQCFGLLRPDMYQQMQSQHPQRQSKVAHIYICMYACVCMYVCMHYSIASKRNSKRDSK